MKTLLKFILIALFCISKIKSTCTGTAVAQSTCEADTTCKWTQTVAAGCSGEGCSDKAQNDCTGTCTWNANALGTCADKTCADYTGQSACNAVATCNWSNNACTTKSSPTTTTCSSYTTEDTCKAVTTCQWSNNACSAKSTTTPTTTTPDDNDDDGVFGLKSSILIFLISFLF